MNGVKRVHELFLQLSNAIVDMDEDNAAVIAREIVDKRLNVLDAIEYGLVKGMEKVGNLYEEEEYFISELLLCADAMNMAMDILKPHIKTEDKKSKGRIVIGSIFGDTHDIGKNIVALLLESAGFDVLDLGRDVSARKFVDGAMDFHADIIAISTLMTTTMNNMSDVVNLLIEENKRHLFKVVIGAFL